MANLSEDIQCAGSDTRPPMLDRTDFASWQQRIRLYYRGKENGVNILKSIDEGLLDGTLSETLQKEMKATNILLQGLPKDIYSLINHYTDAKDIWDNVKMLLEGSELTKEDRESQLYDDFEHFRQHKGECYSGLLCPNGHEAHPMRPNAVGTIYSSQVDPLSLTSSNPRNQATVQDDRVVVQNVQGRQNRGQGNNARGAGTTGYGGAQNRVRNANPGQARHVKCYNCNGGQDNAVDEDVDEKPV
ncbi:hypothetical protein Tco_1055800 [Tanacetum coccineum]|uniref:Integrase, catalytic region, zinc finger, CCHC-type, peptidase aspartic, catalytic n=1 Tax=Tanacetum coccineum TaxID=301880 RepID=A0ABQ5H314_9ASTR